ncbi:MAG: GGDEF domain-containing protein [Pseudomonadota bacterium]
MKKRNILFLFLGTLLLPLFLFGKPVEEITLQLRWLYYSLAIALVLLAAIGFTAIYIYRLNCKIKEQAIHDSLTGLYNRRYIAEILPREIVRAQRDMTPLSLVMIDLDHFKVINDTYGHAAGDAVLKNVAACLLESIRQNDFLCRFGGEEFLIVMSGITMDKAFVRMEACRKKIQNKLTIYDEHTISVTISAGISMFHLHGTHEDELLKAADDALYVSKANGRNRVSLAPVKEYE